MVNPNVSKVDFRVTSDDEIRFEKKTPPISKDGSKNFQKVMRKEGQTSGEGENEEEKLKGAKRSSSAGKEGEAISAVDKKVGEGATKTPSLFDLSSAASKKIQRAPLVERSAGEKDFIVEMEGSPEMQVKKLVKEEQPQEGLGQVQPTIQAHPIEAPAYVEKVERPVPVKAVHELINQIVDQVTSTKMDGRTETTITLKNSELLQGAKIVITEFDTAHGEFNLSFQGLTQAAKGVIENHQNSLMQAFEQKGFVVHIVTTSTIIENRLQAEEGQQLARDQQQRGEEQQRRQQQRDEQEDKGNR